MAAKRAVLRDVLCEYRRQYPDMICRELARLIVKERPDQFPSTKRAGNLLRHYNLSKPGQTVPGIPPKPTPAVPMPGQEYSENGDTASLTVRDYTVRTVEDALVRGNVDTAVWEVDRFIVNSWECNAGGGEVAPLWQVKVWLKRKGVKPPDIAESLAAALKNHRPSYKPLAKPPKRSGVLLELDAADLHYGEYAWGAETGTDYDHAIAEAGVFETLEDLIERTRHTRPERILLPIGNDLLHVDNLEQSTTLGTRQDVDTRMAMMFKGATMMCIRIVDRCLGIAPVDVLVVPGNHDAVSTYHLGVVLEMYYRNVKGVTVDTGPKSRKYYRYGKTLLGFSHGCETDPKLTQFPLLMATECPDEWAATDYHEWHIGHRHTRREERYVAGDTFNGVRVRVLPSLSGTDAWHFKKGYVKNPRAAEAFLWDKKTGPAGEFISIAGKE